MEYECLRRRFSAIKDLLVTKPGEALDLILKDTHDEYKIALDITKILCRHLYTYWTGNLKKKDSDKIKQSVVLTFFHWYFLALSGTWVSEFKYHSLITFCQYHNQEPPPTVDSIHKDGTLYVGVLQNVFKMKMTSKRGRSLYDSFRFATINGVKRGMPDLPKEKVEETLFKHAEALSSNRSTPQLMLDELVRTSHEVFGGKIKLKRPSRLSTSSCEEFKKSSFGPYAFIMKRFYGLEGDDPLNDYKNLATHVLSYRCLYKMETHPVHRECHIHDPIGDLVENFEDILQEAYDKKVSVALIKEPLKVRPITVASVKRNALLQGLQAQMISRMSRFAIFDLTNKTFGPNTLNENGLSILPGMLWISGDYKGATDNLHMDASLAVASAATSDPYIFKLMKESLGGGLIDYSKLQRDYNVPDPVIQTNGQLMGCMISFPLLCIVNAAVARRAFEIAHYRRYKVWRKFSLDELNAVINGDDILIGTSLPDFIPIWENLIKEVGFEKSLGKNFVSEHFATINSQYFQVCGGKFNYIASLKHSALEGVKNRVSGGGQKRSFNQKLMDLKGSIGPSLANWVKKTPTFAKCYRRAAKICLLRKDITASHFAPCHLGLGDTLHSKTANIKFIYNLLGRTSFGSMKIDHPFVERERQSCKWSALMETTAPNFKKDWRKFELLSDLNHEDLYSWAVSKLKLKC